MISIWLQKLIATITTLLGVLAFWEYSKKQAADSREDKVNLENARDTIKNIEENLKAGNEARNLSDDDASSKLRE